MTCGHVKLPGGGTAIVCGRGRRQASCNYCRNAAGYNCDHPVFKNNKKQTCDTPMCEHCRNAIGPGLDLCRPHFNLWRNNGQRFVLGGVEVSNEA